MTIPADLHAYRTSRALTLEQVAASFGVNKTTILRWEEGHVPAERVLAVSQFTGIAPHVLRPDIYPAPTRQGPRVKRSREQLQRAV